MPFPPLRYPRRQIKTLPNALTYNAESPVAWHNLQSRVAKGESSYTAAGTYSFQVPAGVSYISAVCVGAGGSVAIASLGGGGGGLAWRNRIAVTPGETLTVVISTKWSIIMRGSATVGDILCGATAATNIGTQIVQGVPIMGQGGTGGIPTGAGGGGAGGYMGNGGNSTQDAMGGAAGGGGNNSSEAGGGGGTGLTGLVPSWTFANGGSGVGGGLAGVGGTNGGNGTCVTTPVGCPPVCVTCFFGGNGGNYGGGAGQGTNGNGTPGSGGVRIIWPGETRTFPYSAA